MSLSTHLRNLSRPLIEYRSIVVSLLDPLRRKEPFLVGAELHRQLKQEPFRTPRWFAIPEHGLYPGICVVGAICSDRTQAVIRSAMRQLFTYRAHDPERRLSVVLLVVKGDLRRQVRRILESCGRAEDYIEV